MVVFTIEPYFHFHDDQVHQNSIRPSLARSSSNNTMDPAKLAKLQAAAAANRIGELKPRNFAKIGQRSEQTAAIRACVK